ncbi:MAG: hemolysin family protein [Micrococcales bacterium]|nr:hemolysin family protein [Micrococcales bacterium]
MVSQWLAVAAGLILTAGTAMFVAGEFALVAIDEATLDAGASGGGERAFRKALGRTSLYLSAAQVGITLTTIGLGYLTQPALARLLHDWWRDSGWASGASAAALAAALALVLVNVMSMVFGELVPKNLALAKPHITGRRSAPFLVAFTVVFKPVIFVLHGTSTALLRLMRVTPADQIDAARSRRELDFLVRHSADAGTLEPDLADRLSRTLALDDLQAVDAMTDRTQLVVVPREATAAQVIDTSTESGHSRLPVIDGSRDNIVGVVALRQAVAVPPERRSRAVVTGLMSPIEQVPETASLGDVLVGLRAVGAQMAVVLDEYGGTAGVITLEDVVEELVGEVRDEHDPSRSPFRRLADGSWRLPGQTRPDELEAMAGIGLPEDAAYQTIGGLVMARLGTVPAPRDQVTVGGVIIRVEAMDGRRVAWLRVWPPAEGETP